MNDNDEMNIFSEIDDMKAEISDVWGSRNRKRSRWRQSIEEEMTDVSTDVSEEPVDASDDRAAMIQEIEELKRAQQEHPRDFSFDLTVKENGSKRGDHAQKEKYRGLGFPSLYDVITKKYR